MTIDVVVMTAVQHALLALHEEWCGEGGTHFLVELGLRTSVAASLREGDAAVVSQSSGELTPQQLNWEGWGQGGGGVREGEREMSMSGGM